MRPGGRSPCLSNCHKSRSAGQYEKPNGDWVVCEKRKSPGMKSSQFRLEPRIGLMPPTEKLLDSGIRFVLPEKQDSVHCCRSETK